MRILAVINSLQSGGAERILAVLCTEWARAGHDVVVAPFTGTPSNAEVYRVSPLLNGKGRPNNLLARGARPLLLIKRLRALIRRERPDVVLSFMDQANMIALLAASGCTTRVIVAERADPARSSIMDWPAPFSTLAAKLRFNLYNRAYAVVVQTGGAGKYFAGRVIAPVVAIPNPVSEAPTLTRTDTNTVLAVGRLVKAKRFDLLIEAFAQISAKYPQWKLRIVGEGPERQCLEELTARHGLKARIELPGYVSDPTAEYFRAEIFCLSSETEGFPGALCEAMAAGCAVVATNCPFGPSEIIKHGANGLLVPNKDVGAIAEAFSRLISDPEQRNGLGFNARLLTNRYPLSQISQRWLKVFENQKES